MWLVSCLSKFINKEPAIELNTFFHNIAHMISYTQIKQNKRTLSTCMYLFKQYHLAMFASYIFKMEFIFILRTIERMQCSYLFKLFFSRLHSSRMQFRKQTYLVFIQNIWAICKCFFQSSYKTIQCYVIEFWINWLISIMKWSNK